MYSIEEDRFKEMVIEFIVRYRITRRIPGVLSKKYKRKSQPILILTSMKYKIFEYSEIDFYHT